MSKHSDAIIDTISQIRVSNNELWMNILKIAARHAPDETARLFKAICLNDAEITGMGQQLVDELRHIQKRGVLAD
jgi:hypothetical protein